MLVHEKPSVFADSIFELIGAWRRAQDTGALRCDANVLGLCAVVCDVQTWRTKVSWILASL